MVKKSKANPKKINIEEKNLRNNKKVKTVPPPEPEVTEPDSEPDMDSESSSESETELEELTIKSKSSKRKHSPLKEKTKRKYIKKQTNQIECISVRFIETNEKNPNHFLNETIGLAIVPEIIGYGDYVSKRDVIKV